MNIEKLIFENIVYNEQFARKAFPFLSSDYFKSPGDQIIFNLIKAYVDKYNNFPTKEALKVDLSSLTNLSQDDYKSADEIISSFKDDEKELNWLLDKTEAFCQDKALYNALMKAIAVVNDEKGTSLSKGSIPGLLQDALSVSFDTSVGHDFIMDAEKRFDFYHKKERKIPFDIDYLNMITDGGLPSKTLNIIMAGTGVGKTTIMCHMAAFNLMQGLNVLYITKEMSDMRIAERIDANLIDVPVLDLKVLSRQLYGMNIFNIKSKTKGKLIIKEYPTASAGANNFRYLLNELRIKKDFKPDIIYIDYLNLCISSRLKLGANVGSYNYVKTIAEELRGLAVEFNVPIVSATQVNRSGFTDSDFGLEHTSESFGLPATCDFMVGAFSTEDLEKLGQIMFKQLKNRYNDVNKHRKFYVGIDRTKMKLFNVEQSAQDDIQDDVPVMDKSSKFDKDKFKDFV